jgi:hypothetical protein
VVFGPPPVGEGLTGCWVLPAMEGGSVGHCDHLSNPVGYSLFFRC